MASRKTVDRWKPRRRGATYCSPACGGGCSHAEYERARTAGRTLAAALGPGWKLRVWENLGWHVEVVSPSGHLRVGPYFDLHGKATRYMAGVHLDPESPGMTWHATARTPRAALQKVWEQMDRHVALLVDVRQKVLGDGWDALLKEERRSARR